jgi:hypothetical protein
VAHVGAWISQFQRLRLAVPGDNLNRQGLLACSAQGSLLLLCPLWDEGMFRRLQSLQVGVFGGGQGYVVQLMAEEHCGSAAGARIWMHVLFAPTAQPVLCLAWLIRGSMLCTYTRIANCLR